MTDKPFLSFVLPISGTDFVRYIACFVILAEFRSTRGMEPLRPKVIYAASGGSLAAYIAMMSSFSSTVGDWSINSDMFINRTTPFTPRLMTFALHGYLYHRANITEYIRSVFVPALIQDVEIITGYYEQYNPNTYKHTIKIVSNMDKERSVLSTFVPPAENIVVAFPHTPPPKPDTNSSADVKKDWQIYLNSVMSLSIDALHKTSNIPFMMEPLGESEALDYGIVAPSPRVVTNGNPNRMLYFSPVNLDKHTEMKSYEMIFHQAIMNDVMILRNDFNSSKSFTQPDGLCAVMEFIDSICDKTRFCLILYTTAIINVPIHSFSDATVWHYVEACKYGVRALLLYDAF